MKTNRTSKTTSVTAKLWLMAGAFSLNLLLVGVISTRSSNLLGHEIEGLAKTAMPASRSMTLVDMMHDGLRANVFNALLHGNTASQSEKDEIRAENAEFVKSMGENLRILSQLDLDSAIRTELKRAEPTLEDFTKRSTILVRLALDGKKDQAVALLPAFLEKFKKLEGELEALGDLIGTETQKRSTEAVLRADTAKGTSLFVTAISILLGLGFAYTIVRALKRALSRAVSALKGEATRVHEIAQNLSEASQSLSSATTQQASALQETAASVDEITAMVKKTAENGEFLENASTSSRTSADRGKASVAQALVAIQTIATTNENIVKHVEDGNQRLQDVVNVISEIGEKTRVINDIVFQTKLLSFNASVEAARAGEHGKGFAVVAEEVGNLAQMSGKASKEISDLLSSSLNRVQKISQDGKERVAGLVKEASERISQGTQVATACGGSLDEIVAQTGKVGGLVEEIATAIREQNKGISEISKALSLLDQSTHENSATSQQTSATAANLLERSDKVQNIVSELELVLGTTQGEPEQPVEEEPAEAASERAEDNVVPFRQARRSNPTAKASESHETPSANDARFGES